MRISDWSSDVCSSDLFVTFAKISERNSKVKKAYSADLYRTNHKLKHKLATDKHCLNYCISLELQTRLDRCRSEERSVGKECVGKCSSRWSQYHSNKKNNERQ